jgi:hypothetical protein
MAETQEPVEQRAAKAANLFDLRRIIGGLFTVWGVLLIILGATDSEAEANKAAGININLYAGIGMLVFGLLFLLWAFARPLSADLADAGGGTGSDDDGAVGEGGPGA